MKIKPKKKTMRAVWDVETDGLLPSMTQIHCLVFKDVATGEVFDYANQPGYTPIAKGLERLMEYDFIIGHNILDFDIRAVKKIHPWFEPKRAIDTLILSRLAFPDIFSHKRVNKALGNNKGMWMRHSLAAWGQRLGLPKDNYTVERAEMLMEQDPSLTLKQAKSLVWREWNLSMHEYCIQDVEVSTKLYRFLKKSKLNSSAVSTEHYFAQLMLDQTSYGWEFDYSGALELYNELSEKVSDLHVSFLDRWPGWYRPGKVVYPKKNRKVKAKFECEPITIRKFSEKTGKELKPYVGPPLIEYSTDAPYTPVTFKAFNPGSRADCIYILKNVYGWKPTKWTEKGMAKMDEAVLKMVKDEIPLAGELIDFYTLRKRLGQINDGRNGWLKKAKPVPNSNNRWRMHGRINSLGTATHRCTHSNPNMGQVPAAADNMPYGKECRELFTSTPGFLLCGSDADALEMRMLAHYLHEFDGGAMVKAIESGSKELGTDAHSRFRDMIGTDLLGEGKEGRDIAKTLRYAFNYGAGKTKLGKTIKPEASDAEAMEIGSYVVRKMEMAGEGTVELNKKMKKQAEKTGHLEAIDGRILPIRHSFAALNTLLQSAGAIYMKHVLVNHHKALEAAGLEMGHKWHYVGNIHDEFQADVRPEIYDTYADITVSTYLATGEKMGILCPTRGTIDKGSNWAATH